MKKVSGTIISPMTQPTSQKPRRRIMMMFRLAGIMMRKIPPSSTTLDLLPDGLTFTTLFPHTP